MQWGEVLGLGLLVVLALVLALALVLVVVLVVVLVWDWVVVWVRQERVPRRCEPNWTKTRPCGTCKNASHWPSQGPG